MRVERITFFLALIVTACSLAGPAQGGFQLPGPGAQKARSAQAPVIDDSPGKAGAFRQLSSAAGRTRRFSQDSIIVKYKAGVSEAAKEGLHKRHGSRADKHFDRLRMHHVKLKKNLAVEDAVKLYQADPDVEYAEPDFLVTAQAYPNDPAYGNLWGMARINAPGAWDITTGSPSVVVAVIDTGIDYNHPDLAGNVWNNPGESAGNGLDNDRNGYVGDLHGIDTYNHDSDPFDDHFHGTHVAGTIGAQGNNGLGVAGVNWNVKIMACKFLNSAGSGYTSGAIECLEYVKKEKDLGINVVATNNSWGGGDYSQALSDAIAAQGDILFIAAAGNDAADHDKGGHYPSSYDLPNIISVAASDANDQKASFSDYGRYSVQVSAPGQGIYSTFPTAYAPASYGGYGYLSGTSMATPHVTGLAALLRATGKDWKQTKNLILSGGDSAAGLADLTMTGKRINAYGSLSCSDSPVFALQRPPVAVQAGVAVTVAALSINCGAPAGPVSATLTGGQTLLLHDDGVAPDQAAGDGVFSASWTPAGSAGVAATFHYPGGSQTVALPRILLSDSAPVDLPAGVSGRAVSANISIAYRQQFGASGGITPYLWSVAAGSLPPGLSLNGATGAISGTPSATGNYPFTVRVADNLGFSDSAAWSIVVSQGLQAGWPKTLKAKAADGWIPTVNSSPVFADLDGDGKQELIVGDLNTLYVFKGGTLSARYDFPSNVKLTATPAVADLFNDGRKQIIVNVNYPSATPPLYAFDKDLNLLPGFPAGDYQSWNGTPGYCGSPVVADFDNDGKKSILLECAPNNMNDPNWGNGVLVMVTPQGAMVSGWPVTTGPTHMEKWLAEQMPVVGDLYRNGKKEIVHISSDGVLHIRRKDGTQIASWTAATDLGDWANYMTKVWNPVLADFDGDGDLDIAVKQNYFSDPTTQRHRISVFNRNGVLLPGWPLLFSELVNQGGIIAADVDNDGRPEVISNIQTGRFGEYSPDGINYQWHAFKADGSAVAGWPLAARTGAVLTKALPVTGGGSGDGVSSVFFPTSDGDTTLWGYHGSGPLLEQFPEVIALSTWTASSPALGDLDGNGLLDIAVKAEDGTLHVWETSQSASPLKQQWPTFAHDLEHTGALSMDAGVNFSPSPVSGAVPLSVSFTDTSSTSPLTWSWSFGDGGTSTLQNPQHTYTMPGSYTVSLTAGNTGGGATKTKVAAITVYSQLSITTAALPQTTVGDLYSQELSASGGLPPYSWSLGSGSLPAGLTLGGSSGVISGTATHSEAAAFTVQVSDATASKASKALSIAVAYLAPAITTAALPPAATGADYQQGLTVYGGSAPFTWSVSAGSLPAGLALSGSTGIISGISTSAGSATFTIKVVDAEGGMATKQLTLLTCTQLAVATSSLAAGYNLASSYSQTLTAVGGQAPYSWSVVSGSLPATLSLESSTGVISGTPTALGTTSFTVQVRDFTGTTATKALSITVYTYLSFSITTATLLPGSTGMPYNQWLTVSGGAAPFTWSLVENSSLASGSLPDGLSLDAAGGFIFGVPTLPGSYSINPQVTSQGVVKSKRLSLAINDPLCGSSQLRVLRGAAVTPYASIYSANALLADNDQIQLRLGGYSGNIDFTKDLRVSLTGGYNCDYSSSGGSSQIIAARLRVTSGTLKIGTLRFR